MKISALEEFEVMDNIISPAVPLFVCNQTVMIFLTHSLLAKKLNHSQFNPFDRVPSQGQYHLALVFISFFSIQEFLFPFSLKKPMHFV